MRVPPIEMPAPVTSRDPANDMPEPVTVRDPANEARASHGANSCKRGAKVQRVRVALQNLICAWDRRGHEWPSSYTTMTELKSKNTLSPPPSAQFAEFADVSIKTMIY